MNLIKQIYLLYDNFSDENCWAIYGCDQPDLESDWKDKIENELNLIQEHSPISLPEDYCEIFRTFGGGAIEDERDDYVIPTMTFWTWADIDEFIESEAEDFFEECPNALPFGDDEGDMFYFFMKKGGEIGVYIAEKGGVPEAESRHKIANSLTELFTDAKVQKKFRKYYECG